jgi:hypothetical protein
MVFGLILDGEEGCRGLALHPHPYRMSRSFTTYLPSLVFSTLIKTMIGRKLLSQLIIVLLLVCGGEPDNPSPCPQQGH